ncbi:MAG TPA: serine/threonine-protein kinase [Polyangia bacterium]|nr:serine/threonine-protein kinase [Polyangia bacterium]
MSESDDSKTKGEPANPTEPQPAGDVGLRPGDRIGRYVLISSVGQGGMGVVFLAYDPELDRKVALKLLRIGKLGATGKQRLLREAQALARLSHPNVVPVYDVGTLDQQAFVAMEYVEGQTLKRWLKTPRPWREVVAVMKDAGRGLAAAHAAGLVHRDFKPDNVLIGVDGRVRVVDFGLAREVEDLSNPSGVTPADRPDGRPVRFPKLSMEITSERPRDSHHSLSQVTRADQIIGTPAYMAPEQVVNRACDDRADQFSFGVTFYEALYRQRPYDTTDTIDGEALVTIAAKRTGAPRSIAAEPPRGSDVPSWVQKIVMRALSHDPIHRFPTMDALLAALDKDPALARRRVFTAVAMIVVLGLGAVGFVRGQAAKRRMCEGALDEVHKAWSPETRERVRLAFAKTNLSYADLAATTVGKLLDQFAVDWSNQYKDACEATRVRGEVSEDVLDLRMACLDDRLKELSALASVMEHPDNDTVQEAPRAARALSPVTECADIAALKAETPRPRDEHQAKRVDELKRRLAAMQAQHAVGKNLEALKLGEPLLVDARAVGWQPLVAEVELWIGRAGADQGDDKKSIPGFKEAFAAALAGRDDKTLKEAAARLAQEYIYKNQMSDFDYWEEVARAALTRGTPDPHLESWVEHTHCIALYQLGRVKERLRCLEQHAQKSRDPLNEWELTMLGIAAKDAGQYTEAIDWLRRGVDFSIKEFGATHPRTLEMRAYLCDGYLELGDYGQALSECQAALRTVREVAPDNAYLVARIELYLGSTLREMKRYAEAKKLLLESQKVNNPEGDVVLGELAQIASATGDAKSALSYYKKSLDEDSKNLPAVHPNVVGDRQMYAETLLAMGQLEPARAQLEQAYKALNDDMNPLSVADVTFDYARALWLTRPAEHNKALQMARAARQIYVENAPKTERFQSSLAKIEKWLADEATRRTVADVP